MGEAIARFRQAALEARRKCDACFYSPLVGTGTQHEWFDHFAALHSESMEDGYSLPATYCEEMNGIRSIIEDELHEMAEATGIELSALDLDELTELAEVRRDPVHELKKRRKEERRAKEEGSVEPADPLRPSQHKLRPSPEIRQLATLAVADAVEWQAMAVAAELHINSLAKATEAMCHEVSLHEDAMDSAWDGVGLEPHDPLSYHIDMVPDLLSYAEECRDSRDERYAAAVQRWFDAYFALAPFEGSPAPAHANAASSASPSPTREKRKSRKGIGGAKRKGSPVNELHTLRAEYEARCRRLKKTPDPLKQWLCDWGTAHDMLYAECHRTWKREDARMRRAGKR